MLLVEVHHEAQQGPAGSGRGRRQGSRPDPHYYPTKSHLFSCLQVQDSKPAPAGRFSSTAEIIAYNKKLAAERKAAKIDLDKLYTLYTAEYSRLYNSDGPDDKKAEQNAAKVFDDKSQNDPVFHALVDRMIQKMDDFISSDREAAAFVLALDKLNAPEQPHPPRALRPSSLKNATNCRNWSTSIRCPRSPPSAPPRSPKATPPPSSRRNARQRPLSWPCPKRTARRRPKPSAHGARHEKMLRKLRTPPPLCNSLILQALPPVCWHDTKPPRILWQGCTDESNPAPLPTAPRRGGISRNEKENEP